MTRTRLFHTVVIVGSGLLASCGKGRERKPEPHDALATVAPVDASTPAPPDAGADASVPLDAGTPDAAVPPARKPPKKLRPPPRHPQIMD
jgi:hypothetical protein